MFSRRALKAHPRSRGENIVSGDQPRRGPGSSPLTRGKRGYRADRGAHPRLIPAHAGKTAAMSSLRQNSGAHPRSRGENAVVGGEGNQADGSSPLTRGKHRRPSGPSKRVRLIPAHAGKTSAASERTSRARAHPRSRGENNRIELMGIPMRCSSPLTRGQRRGLRGRKPISRLIPAHAGKTATPAFSATSSAAHPRSRGENAITSAYKHSVSGSSPLTRGKLPIVVGQSLDLGLIPAHAGKTEAEGFEALCDAAHPRSRGENEIFLPALISVSGSSPLTRGKPVSATLALT